MNLKINLHLSYMDVYGVEVCTAEFTSERGRNFFLIELKIEM